MKNRLGSGLWHLLAILTIVLWGTSFVSTKVLLIHGFSATLIFYLRFVFTYFFLLILSHDRIRSNSWRDECKLFVCGLMMMCYFWFENTALEHSTTSNVSLIVCTNPLMILIVVSLMYDKERLSCRQLLGTLLTFSGMVLVVLNGRFNLKISPVGDCLALCASLVWVVYSIRIRSLQGKYSTLFITRKIFFYSILSSLPVVMTDTREFPVESVSETAVILNFLLLTLGSSLFGYVVWNAVLKNLGTVLASNYIYAIPLVTILTAVVAIDECITPTALLGAFFIVGGMVLAEWKS